MTTLPHPIPYQGSKRKLAQAISRYLPEKIETFYEPFAGSAAMTIYAAYHRRTPRFVLADSLAPMIGLPSRDCGDAGGNRQRIPCFMVRTSRWR